MREGRTFRSAVPRGWVRARRTILSADAVLFLAAAVLYLLAVGEVKGFAFTLGLSTVLDLVVVFLVTHPLVALRVQLARCSAVTDAGPAWAAVARGSAPIASAAAAAAGAPKEPEAHGHRPRPGAGRLSGLLHRHRLLQHPRRAGASGTSSSALSCSSASASIVFRGFHFGIDFAGGTSCSSPPPGRPCTADVGGRRGHSGDRAVEPTRCRRSAPAARRAIRSARRTLDRSSSVKQALAATCAPPEVSERQVAAAISDSAVVRTWGGEIIQRALLALGVFLVLVAVFLWIRFETRDGDRRARRPRARPDRHRRHLLAGRVRGDARRR